MSVFGSETAASYFGLLPYPFFDQKVKGNLFVVTDDNDFVTVLRCLTRRQEP